MTPAALTKEAILNILQTHDNNAFLTTGNSNKQTELTRLIANPEVPVFNIKDLGTLLGVAPESLESPEEERNYAAIAEGKVTKALNAVEESDLPEHLKKKILLVGDDYGAAVGALRFTHDPQVPAEKGFAVDFGEDGHITAIRTNREELDAQPAPGYFSKRIKKAVASQHGVDPNKEPDAMDALGEELFYAAARTGDRSTSVTVAIAVGRPMEEKIHTVLKTANYQLVEPHHRGNTGFDFDRFQSLDGEHPISSWSTEEKDRDFPRGLAVREAMAQALGQQAGFAARVEGEKSARGGALGC